MVSPTTGDISTISATEVVTVPTTLAGVEPGELDRETSKTVAASLGTNGQMESIRLSRLTCSEVLRPIIMYGRRIAPCWP